MLQNLTYLGMDPLRVVSWNPQEIPLDLDLVYNQLGRNHWSKQSPRREYNQLPTPVPRVLRKGSVTAGCTMTRLTKPSDESPAIAGNCCYAKANKRQK